MAENSMTWFVLASGPSLTFQDLERVRYEKEQGRAMVVAVNSTAFDAPFADYCFAMDGSWLKYYRGRCRDYGWRVVSCKVGCEVYGAEYTGPLDGSNSGLKAISFAAPKGAGPIIVLGLDCTPIDGETHHHGGHPDKPKDPDFANNWPDHARELEKTIQGRRIINCSPHSDAFEHMKLEDYLGY